MTDARSTSGARACYMAAVLCLVHAVSIVDRFITVLVAEPLRQSLAISDTQLGLLHGTGFVILYCSAAIPLGWLADVTHRRNLIIGGVALWSAATAGAAFAETFAQLFLLRVLVGMGEACLIPAGMSMLAATFLRHELTRGTAIFGLGAYVGHGMAMVGGAALLAALTVTGGLSFGSLGLNPWRSLFLIAGLAGPIAILLLLTVREPARSVAAGDAPRVGISDAARYLFERRAAYGFFCLAGGANSAISYSLMSWVPSVLVRERGFSVPEAGSLIGVLGLAAGLAGATVGGWIVDRLVSRGVSAPPLRVFAACATIALIGVALFALLPGQTSALAALFLALLAVGMAMPALYGGIQLLTPDRFRGLAASLNMVVYTMFGLGIGPVTVGAIADALGGGGRSLSTAVLLAATGFAAIVVTAAIAGHRAYEQQLHAVR